VDFLLSQPGIAFFLQQFNRLLLSVGSHFSLTSLAAAFVLGAGFIAWRRFRRGRRVRLKVIWRALFPKRLVQHKSNSADLGYLFFNVFAFGIVFGWGILTYQWLTNAIIATLAQAFGPMPSIAPAWFANCTITLMLFLAYEIGYWLNHWLSHRVPFMWEFHKVHHSAEVLSPLTNFRVHPVYALIFANILAITAATANGIGNYLFGNTAHQYAISDTNLIVVVFIHVYVHLQHTHLWIPFRGVLGRLFVSPAHHQVHHSTDPRHFNKNFGSCLAVWDWAFGTLHIPEKEREITSFGVEPDHHPAHTVRGELSAPFLRVVALFRARKTSEPAAGAADTQNA
jgi:sterol desaturase/sphingolipid hydroxylase (fatty acid hydroxylase superfamily)